MTPQYNTVNKQFFLKTMSTFNFNQAELTELKSSELRDLDGGNPIVIGVIIYLISEDWPNIKKGARDAFNDAFN